MKAPQLTESELLDDSPSPITIDNWIIRINTLLSIYKEARDLNSIEEDPNHKLDLRELEGLERDILKLETIQQELVENPRNWVFTGNIKLGVKNGSFEMKPVWIDEYTEKYMFRHAKNHVLIMSATLPPKKEFCKWHGLNEDDVYYIDVESNFKLENRQIQIITRGKMTKNDYHRTFPLIAPVINTILSRHENEKGIIHTQSDKYTKMVYDAIYDKNRVFWYSKDDETKKKREETIKKFKYTGIDGAVLVSPGIKEGIDLPGDMCEYQIILKIPFPYLGDKQIKRRLHDEPSWYAYKTANDLEQAYGRGVRTYNDKCTTYIVDGSILRIKNSREHRRFMSKYFKKALDTAIIN
jgi:Rad3-related DNA helicase